MSATTGEAWIIDGTRSPRGKGKSNGSLHHIHPQEVLAQTLNALAARTGIDKRDVDDVIIGNGNPAGDHGSCIGRMAVLAAEWPVETAGVTLNRFCGSGQQAITFAAMGIQAGHQQLVVGGGVESMSRWPQTDGPPDFTSGNAALREKHPLVPQGISADLIATREGFSRADVDAFAVESQNRCARAIAEGAFDRSVVPILNPDGSVALAVDEFPRPGSTIEGMAALKASFDGMGAMVFEGYDRSFDDMCKQVYPDVDHVEHVHPRRQFLRRRRRRQRGAAGLRRVRQGPRPQAPRPARDERRRRCRAGDHAHRAGPVIEEVPRAGRHDRR
jgi:acetyl-CoA C-acetyltransferase